MSLYSYEKAPVKVSQKSLIHHHTEQVVEAKRKPVTLGYLYHGLRHDLDTLLRSSRLAALLVPAVLIITGAYIIFNQVWPTTVQAVKEASGYYDNNATPLVAGQYVTLNEQYSNPGAKYFAELKNSAQSQNLLFNDQKSAEFKNSFSLSIPSLGLKDLKVSANVDSSVEAVYDQLLEDGLAHFAGTGLPITDLNSYNAVIYGHSSAGDYYQRTKDPAAAFSVLSEIKYGSEIIVKLNNQEYKYKFIKGKIVDAMDLSILQGTRNQKTLTLFTCYPNGNNAKRFVATARLIE